jgi:hypothetical protein
MASALIAGLIAYLTCLINRKVFPEECVAQLRSILVARRAPDGGWSHFQNPQISLEATCLGSLALANTLKAPKLDSDDVLFRLQNRDGSWPAFAGDYNGCWTTALAMVAVAFCGGPWSVVERGARFLIETKGREAHWLWRWKFKLVDTQAQFDPDKHGWPWLPGASSWVIPTAFALVALKQFVSCTPSEAARQRIRTGVEMLFDRACVGGGWNAGNRIVYGAPLASHVEPTTIALIALQDEFPNQIIRDSLAWLKVRVENLTAIWSLSWSILSLFLYGVPVGELKRRLADRIGDGSLVRDNATIAVAALALRCGDTIHPFALVR